MARSNAARLVWFKKRREADPGWAINRAVRKAMWFSLKNDVPGRGWEAKVGYNLATLRQHLERQFAPGMSWDNYGTRWQLDHVIPLGRFHHRTEADEDFRLAWALTNIQPAWAEDNRAKRDRLTALA